MDQSAADRSAVTDVRRKTVAEMIAEQNLPVCDEPRALRVHHGRLTVEEREAVAAFLER